MIPKIGSLKKQSNIRANRLFTTDKKIITKKVGKIQKEEFIKVSSKICEPIKF
jgi:hypothetical protein